MQQTFKRLKLLTLNSKQGSVKQTNLRRLKLAILHFVPFQYHTNNYNHNLLFKILGCLKMKINKNKIILCSHQQFYSCEKLIQSCSLLNRLASFEGYFIAMDHKKSLKLIKKRLSRNEEEEVAKSCKK